MQVTRSLLYIEEPKEVDEKIRLDWDLFLDNLPIEKSEPHSGNLKWVQLKYNAMGATALAIEMTSSSDLSIQLASYRLLNALLQDGNREVQDSVYTILKNLQHDGFFRSCAELLQASSILVNKWQGRKVSHQQGRGGSASGPGDAMFESEQLKLIVLREMLQSLCTTPPLHCCPLSPLHTHSCRRSV